jgi:hypothetical protein
MDQSSERMSAPIPPPPNGKPSPCLPLALSPRLAFILTQANKFYAVRQASKMRTAALLASRVTGSQDRVKNRMSALPRKRASESRNVMSAMGAISGRRPNRPFDRLRWGQSHQAEALTQISLPSMWARRGLWDRERHRLPALRAPREYVVLLRNVRLAAYGSSLAASDRASQR